MKYDEVRIVAAENGQIAFCQKAQGTQVMYVWQEKKAPKFDMIIKQVRQQKKSDVPKELPALGDEDDEVEDDDEVEEEEGVEV